MESAGTCIVCPQRDLQTSAIGSTSVSDCECVAGYYSDSGTCTACPSGTYKAGVSNSGIAACLACAATQTSEPGSHACACPYGYHQASSGADCTPLVVCPAGQALHPTTPDECVECPVDTYSTTTSTNADACVACPSGTTTGGATGATSASQCQCRPGMVSYAGSDNCYRE